MFMKKLGILLLIILVGLAIWLIVKTDKVADESALENNGGVSGQFAKLAENAVVVIEQRLTDVVVANSINMKAPGFVVIYRDAGGKPGAIIGVSKWFAAGQYSHEEIGLTEALMADMNYYAELRADDGNGIFDPKDDKAVAGLSGETVMATFTANKDAVDPKSVQIYY